MLRVRARAFVGRRAANLGRLGDATACRVQSRGATTRCRREGACDLTSPCRAKRKRLQPAFASHSTH